MTYTIKATFLLLCLLMNLVYAQTDSAKDMTKLEKGQEIIDQSRKAIDKGNVLDNLKSFYINFDRTIPGRTYNGKEISVITHDKIRIVDDSRQFKIFRILNGGRYSEDSQMILNGEAMPNIRQTEGQTSKREIPPYILESLSKERIDYLKKNPDELNRLMLEDGFWSDVFPVLLSNPLNKDIKYEYVGKAEAAAQKADIIDAKSNFYRKIRFFFDEKTHLLLMMNVELDLPNYHLTARYYFPIINWQTDCSSPEVLKTRTSIFLKMRQEKRAAEQ